MPNLKGWTETATRGSVFIPRFLRHVVLWFDCARDAFSRYEIFFWLLISAFGWSALLEFYRMLDHAHLPNFKYHRIDCGAIMLAGSFHYFSTIGRPVPTTLELALLFFFLWTMFARQMFRACLRHDEPLQTMAITRCSDCFTCFGFSISPPKILYLRTTVGHGNCDRQFYCLYLIA